MLIRKVNLIPGTFQLLAEGKTVAVASAERDGGAYPIPAVLIRGDAHENWTVVQNIADVPEVDSALRELVEDSTSDNGVRVVQAVLKALANYGQ